VSELWLVTVRELRERARSKAFIGSTVFTLLMMIAIVVVVVITSDGGPRSFSVGRAAEAPAVDEAVEAAATATGVIVDLVPLPSAGAGRAALVDGTLDAVIVDATTVLVGEDRSDLLETVLTLALRQARFLEGLEEIGISPAEAADLLGGRVDVTSVTGDDGGDGALGLALIGVVLLFVVISMYGQWVLIGVLEEKTNRVVELIAAAVPIRTLLAGKVLGIGVLALAQLLIMLAIGLGSSLGLGLIDLPEAAGPMAAWSVVWFLLGFALYAVINAAAGSLVSRQEDAQTAVLPIGIAAATAYMATFLVIVPAPDSPLAMALSLLPPIAPIAFPARIALEAVAPWEIALGLAITCATIFGVIRLAARVYTGALLKTGARVSWRQAWRASRDVAGG
jgi:ABC-2 type transport system permease protein